VRLLAEAVPALPRHERLTPLLGRRRIPARIRPGWGGGLPRSWEALLGARGIRWISCADDWAPGGRGGGQVVRRSGLRMRMAVSYVLVTAAAVVLVDGVVLGVLLPRMLAGSTGSSAVRDVAGTDARRLTEAAVGYAGRAPAGTTGGQVLEQLADGPEAAALGLATTGGPVSAGSVKECLESGKAEALISPDGTVLASNRPASCPPGVRLWLAAKPGFAGRGTSASAPPGIRLSGRSCRWPMSPQPRASNRRRRARRCRPRQRPGRVLRPGSICRSSTCPHQAG